MAVALLTAQVVTLALLTSEIHVLRAIRNGHLERELMLSITWASTPPCSSSSAWRALRAHPLLRDLVLALTIGKVFFFDMAELDRIYRVGSVLALPPASRDFLPLQPGRKPIDDRKVRYKLCIRLFGRILPSHWLDRSY